MMKFFNVEEDTLKKIEKLNGKITIKMENGEVNIDRSCNLHSLCFMFSALTGMVYKNMRKGIKPEVENPEQEIIDAISHLVTMGIENQKMTDRLEALRDNPSTDVFLEILKTALDVATKNSERYTEGGDSK